MLFKIKNTQARRLQWLTDEENIFHFKSPKMARKT